MRLRIVQLTCLLWANVEDTGSKVYFGIVIDAGKYEKYAFNINRVYICSVFPLEGVNLSPSADKFMTIDFTSEWEFHVSMTDLPGPLAPPDRSRPSRKMTARSYSWTTLKHTKRENGIVRNTTTHDKKTRIAPHTPESSTEDCSAKWKFIVIGRAIPRSRWCMYIHLRGCSSVSVLILSIQVHLFNTVLPRTTKQFSHLPDF